MAKKTKLKLKVIFDTNVIYTGSASDLLRNEIVELINSHKSLTDLEIEWYIPDTVIQERIFQMNKKGNELLLPIQKLEKLLGHNLNINKEIIEGRIVDSIKKQLTSLNIRTIKIDTTRVDWNLIIHNSLTRQIPFEDNEKEKGFRDALILESLKQIIFDSPTTKTICRIAFITNDNILNKAATELSASSSNVYVFSDIDEFVSLINILDSEITEDLINKIILDSEKLFFEKENQTTLYYTQGIGKYITDNFLKEFNIKQDGADSRENGTWWISRPGFEMKRKQQVVWKTIISVDFTSYKTTSLLLSPNLPTSNSLGRKIYGIGMLNSLPENYYYNVENQKQILQSTPQFSTTKEKIGEGKTRFEITWSVTLTVDNKLKNPKIDNIKFLDTIFI